MNTLALLNSVLINSRSKFNLKSNLHSDRLMPPSRSEMTYKLSAITMFSKVAWGSWLLVILQTKQPSLVTLTVFNRVCSPLHGVTGGTPSLGLVSVWLGAFYSCTLVLPLFPRAGRMLWHFFWMMFIKTKQRKNKERKKKKRKFENSLATPILLCGMSLHCS